MSYLSFDVSQKITKGSNPKGYGNHVFRKSLERDFDHKNDLIDKDLTKYNVDALIDGQSFEERFENRLKDYNGKRKLRKDAVLLRGFVAQPSADVFKGMDIKQKRETMLRFTKDISQWLTKEFTKENLIGMSIHLDETSPHVHGAIMPMTEDGRLSQKDFFKGPKQLKQMHQDLRKFMNDKGWDFDLNNKYESSRHYELDEYKKNGTAIEAARQKITDDVRLGKKQLEKREKALEARESDFEEVLTIKYKSKEDSLRRQETALKARENALKVKEQELADAEKKYQANSDMLYHEAERLQHESHKYYRGLMAMEYLLKDSDKKKLWNFIHGENNQSEIGKIKQNVNNTLSEDEIINRVATKEKQQQDDMEL